MIIYVEPPEAIFSPALSLDKLDKKIIEISRSIKKFCREIKSIYERSQVLPLSSQEIEGAVALLSQLLVEGRRKEKEFARALEQRSKLTRVEDEKISYARNLHEKLIKRLDKYTTSLKTLELKAEFASGDNVVFAQRHKVASSVLGFNPLSIFLLPKAKVAEKPQQPLEDRIEFSALGVTPFSQTGQSVPVATTVEVGGKNALELRSDPTESPAVFARRHQVAFSNNGYNIFSEKFLGVSAEDEEIRKSMGGGFAARRG